LRRAVLTLWQTSILRHASSDIVKVSPSLRPYSPRAQRHPDSRIRHTDRRGDRDALSAHGQLDRRRADATPISADVSRRALAMQALRFSLDE
jgi:hypothetical protein